jgi:hypothetical protein
MTVCLVGDSHLICVHKAIEAAGFALSRDHLLYPCAAGGPRVEGGTLVPRSERDYRIVAKVARKQEMHADARLSLADQDAFVLVGLGLSPRRIAPLFERYRLWRPGADVDADHPFLSSSCFVDAAAGLIARSAAARLAREIRACSDAPIYMVQSPAPSAAMPDLKPTAPVARRLQEVLLEAWAHFPEGPDLRDLWLDAFERACGEAGAVALPQPSATLDGAFTQARFQDGDDFIHVDAAYGEIVLRQIDAAIG